MNELGYPPRTWAYLTALDLSETINALVLQPASPEHRADTERFAEEQWKLVVRLDYFSRATTNRKLPELQAAVADLRVQAERLAMSDGARGHVKEKIDEIEAALAEVAAEGRGPAR